MFVTIRQTQANGSHLFQVEGEDQVLFRAQTPWADVRLPFQMEHLRRLSFTDADGNEVFHTAYNVLENTLQSVSRYKYLFGSATKLGEYQVVGRDGAVYGSFYTQIDGAFTKQMTIDYREHIYDCYARALGRIYVISVFDGERQIAQITKPLDTWNRLDVFYLHLEDGCRDMLPILSFFTIYVDARQFNRPGRYSTCEVEKSWSYTFDRNNRKYDPNWIRRTFGPAAADQLNQLLSARPEQSAAELELGRKMKRRLIGILAALGVGVVVCAIVLLLPLFQGKTALVPGDFAVQMSEYGYTVTAEAPPELEGGWELAFQARSQAYSIWYLSYPTEQEARQAFSSLEDQFVQNRGSSYSEVHSNLLNSAEYALTSGGTYSVVSRIDNTLVLCTTSVEHKGAVKEIFQELGY